MRSEGRLLRLAVLALVLGGIAAPILLGLWETARAAFGILPAIGATEPSLSPWAALAERPGLRTSLILTAFTGVGATLLSATIALAVAARIHRRPGLTRLLAPFLATPHAAMAIGLAFVIAPSGWIARTVSPWATGWEVPPDLATVHDRAGLALLLGLLVKEVPFLLLVTLSALNQLPVSRLRTAGRALGYGPGVVWVKVLLPQVYPLVRLPIFVVLAFSLSVVDMAIVLGPSNPPTLAVAVTRWFFDPDLRTLLPASAAALSIAFLTAVSIGLWIAAERLAVVLERWWLRRGGRGLTWQPGLAAGDLAALVLLVFGTLSLAALLVWSLAWRWSFPEPLPASWSLRNWSTPGQGWGEIAVTTLLIGCATTVAALVLSVAWLEGEDRARRGRARWAEWLVYLPLVVPQIAFLYGLNVVFLRAGLSGGHLAVVWAQTLFVFPYVMITLSDPWRALDRRHLTMAAALGARPWRRLWGVKLPMLLGPILTAAAIGFAVSVAQYLPTLFIGAGRVATLTTEAVTLSSGSDRRITGLYAMLQAALPALAYVLALAIPLWVYRHRRGLRGGAVG